MKRERSIVDPHLLPVGTSEGGCSPFCALGHCKVLNALLLHHLLLLLLLHLDRISDCVKEVLRIDYSKLTSKEVDIIWIGI